MPLAHLGQKKYYLGMFFKVSRQTLMNLGDFSAGKLVPVCSVLQVPRNALGKVGQVWQLMKLLLLPAWSPRRISDN